MGVDSKAYLPNTTKKQIKDFMFYIARDVRLQTTHDDTYHILNFTYRKEERNLHLFYRTYKKDEYIKNAMDRYNISKEEAKNWADEELEGNELWKGTSGILASFGYWGRSVEILQLLCYRFGGYLDESDSDDKDFYKIKKNHRKIIPTIFKE